jgi:glycosyltransferase involved in cell wall biosynthesis
VLPYQPREALGEVLSAADLHLVTQAAGTEGQVVPSKLYGILAAGRPCLYIGPAGTEVAMTVGEHGVGSCVLPGDVEGAVAAVRAWRHRQREGEAFERRAREVCRMHFSREIGCAQLTAVVEELAATGAVRGEAVRPVAGGMKPR